MSAIRLIMVVVSALALGLLVGTGNCSASGSDLDFTWIAGSGTWDTPANWQTNFYSYFDTNGLSTCRPTNFVTEVRSNLTTCAGGGTGTIPNSDFQSAFFTNSGTCTITFSGNDVVSSNIFANASNTAATVTLDLNGNRLEDYDAFTVAANGVSTTTVYLVTSVAGGRLLLHAGLSIGQNGFGTLVVNSGTVDNGTGSANLGTRVGGRGVLVVTGPNSSLWPNYQISIGNDPQQDPAGSMLVISNGAHVQCTSSFRLGSGSGKGGSSNNLCVVNPGSILACDTGPVSIGLRSTGVTNANGGTLCFNNVMLVKSGALWACASTSTKTMCIGDAAFFGLTQAATASPPAICTGNLVRIESGGVVTGISTLYIGPTNSLELLGGRLEALVTSNWGTMVACGTYRGEYRGYAGGMLKTRNSLGTLVISNGLWLVTNSVLEVELGTNCHPTEVFFNRATNRLEITGATLNILDSGGFGLTNEYDLINYSTDNFGQWHQGTNAWGFTNFTGFVIGQTPNAGYTYTVDTNTFGKVKLLVGGIPAPVAGFTANPTNGTAPLAVAFTDTSTGAIIYRFWDFGDGISTNTTATSMSHTYNAGTNTVSLIVSGYGGSSTNTRPNYIVATNPLPPATNFTTNPMTTLTTNTTALVSIGNGFGVALMGYGLPESNVDTSSSSNYLFFATPMGQPSASDAIVSNGVYQFYIVGTDRDGNAPFIHSDLFALKVTSPVSSPGNLTVVRTWLARVTTNDPGFVCAGSLAACGVTTNGSIIVRADTSLGVHASTSQQSMFVYDANSLNTVIITNVLDASCLVTQQGAATLKFGSVGRNKGLLAGNNFGNTQYVARADMTATDANLQPHGQLIATDYDRSAHSINDTARVLAYWKRTQDEQDLSTGSDACTHLAVFYYNDNGGSITLDTSRGDGTGSNVWAFGTRDGNDLLTNHISTNAIDFFAATAFNGPAQISINDNGEMAFPVSINCYVGNYYSNGTRTATITGILFKGANSGTFRKVVDNQDTTLFAPAIIPGPGEFWAETNNLISPPVLDNKGNVFFEAGLTNVVVAGTNYQNIAIFQSVPNQYPNPTGWTTRIVLREGDTFVEPTSGHTIKIMTLPLATGGGASRANVPRSLGANSINRTPVPGTTADLGGVIVCATLTNLTAQTRYDGLLYVAPLITMGSLDAGANSWSSSSDGKWETGTNWSLGLAPSINQSVVLITNANSKTVTIDDATTNAPATMTISNLIVSAPLNSTNTLFLDKAGVLSNPLLVLNSVTVGSGGAISVTNSSLQVDAFGGVSGYDAVIVGASGAGNQLNIMGGVVSGSWGLMGYNSGSSNNTVRVSGTGSKWSNGAWLSVGWSGAGNQLIIDNGGQVSDRYGYLGHSFSSTSNVVLVSGAGSVWSNEFLLYVGASGAGNSLVVSNGGRIISNSGTLGQAATSYGNAVLVTGTGSVWSNSGFLWLGNSGSGNSLVISNGGQVINRTSGLIGVSSNSSNNGVLVSGAGSVWRIGSSLYVGSGGPTNRLTVDTGGSVIASNVYIGSSPYSVGNQIFVNGGALYATNAPGSGVLDVRPGTLSFNGGTITVDELLANSVSFNNGVLNTKATFVTNAAAFTVGDGASPANLHLLGGFHTFDGSLRIRSSASLTGCGTISGNMVIDVGGTVSADCGSTLDFSGTVTNDGSVVALNGTTISFYSPVVNNGTINGTGGGVRFYSTLQNNGVVQGAANSWIDGSGKWETAANWWLGTAPSSSDAVNLLTNAGNNTVTIDATTVGNSPSTLTINNLTVSAPGVAANTLFLDNAGTTTPLRVSGVLMLGTNGSMVVNNSAVQAANSISIGDSSPSSSLVVSNGGSLIVTNDSGTASVVVNGGSLILGTGTFKTDSLVITNGGAVQHTQTYEVDNSTVTVAGGSEEAGSNLVAGSSVNSTGIVTVTDGGQLVVTNGVVGIGNNGTFGDGGRGLMVVSNNGTLLASIIRVGNSGTNNQSDLIVAAGGTIRCPDGTNCLLEVNSLGTDVDGTFNYDGSTAKYGLTAPADHYQDGGETDFGDLYAGFSDSATITVAGGILHLSSRLIVGYSGSPAAVTGTVWVTGGQVTVGSYSIIGDSGVGQMTISNGIVTAADMIVGNSSSNPGTLTLAGGTLTVNTLTLPNPGSRFIFSGGRLDAQATVNANGQAMTVGGGKSPATFRLSGGIHSFNCGLCVRTNAMLCGGGTLTGNVVTDPGGTVVADCGSTFNFSGVWTNNGNLVAVNGTTVNFYGPVVNNGTIDVTGGGVHFYSTLQNNGVVLGVTNTWTAGSGKWETAAHWWAGAAPSSSDVANLITNAGNKTVTIDATTAGDSPRALTVNSLTVSGQVGTVDTLVLNNFGAGVALQVLNGFIADGNSVIIVSNAALVAGSGGVAIGNSGSGNQMIIAAGSQVQSAFGYVGNVNSSGSNVVVVTGIGSVWSNQTYFDLGGSNGCSNVLTVKDGGMVNDQNGSVGWGNNSCNNSALVTGPGSVWSNWTWFSVGNYGVGNSLIISNGGAVYSGSNSVLGWGSGSSNNTALVTGDGSVWNAQLYLGVGYSGSSNLLDIAGGSVVATNVLISYSGSAADNVLRVDGGSLVVTNGQGTGAVVVSANGGKGSLILNSGSVTVNSLVANHGANSVFTFNGGLLISGGTSVDNGQVLAVGNGTDAATFQLNGGVHSFANDMKICNNASLTGCGTVNGNVVVDSGGTVLDNCGGQLTFTGILTNNGTIRAINGSALEVYGTMVNHGTIDIINGGATNFHSGFINNGTVVDARSVKISQVSKSSQDFIVQIPSVVGHTYQLQFTASLTLPNWVNTGSSQSGTGRVLTFTDPGGATNAQRFYRVNVTAP